MTISRIGGLEEGSLLELMKMLIKRRAALTVEGGKDFKISRGVCYDVGVGENVKTLGANGIYTETIVESEFVVEKVVNGTGRHVLEIFGFIGRVGRGSRREGYTRRKSDRWHNSGWN
jgi:hypothetical protein